MNKLLLISTLIAGMAISACQKTDDVQETISINSATDSLIASGTFKRTTKNTSGTAKVYRRANDLLLVFENFKTGSGPDVRIYLSTTVNAKPFINLGTLAKEGTFSISLPLATDISNYKYVCIWCEPFTQIFGTAELVPTQR